MSIYGEAREWAEKTHAPHRETGIKSEGGAIASLKEQEEVLDELEKTLGALLQRLEPALATVPESQAEAGPNQVNNGSSLAVAIQHNTGALRSMIGRIGKILQRLDL
jgi:hypothetical protein